jgi:Fe-Mn family superoxide dismutase
MAIELPPLPYAKNALAPHISEETLEFHYGKHHAGYVTRLNTALAGTPDASKSLEDLVKTATGANFNNAAQIWNHTFYWNSLSPNGGGEPTGKIADAIKRDFGGFAQFKEAFTKAAGGHFGSGWAWLVLADGKLKIVETHDAACPLRDGQKPILTCDVWEHAYYIDYRNARPDYIAAWWNLVNWSFANKNLG